MRRAAAACTAFAAALLAAAALAALPPIGGGRASAQEADCFGRPLLPGYTLAAFAGGGLAWLEHCAAAFGSRIHATGEDGAWLTLDPGAAGEANAAFRARFAGGAAAGTPFLLERSPALGLTLRAPGSFEGYTLFAPRQGVIYLIGHDGLIAHRWTGFPMARPINARLRENGNLLLQLANRIWEIEPDGETAWEYEYDGDGGVHHDYLLLPNGNLLLLVGRAKTPEEAVAAGADPDLVSPQGLSYEALAEVRLDGTRGKVGGEIVWEWSMWDHLIQDFDPSKPNYGDVAGNPQLVDLNFGRRSGPADPAWIHANSIDYHPGLNQIVISARNFSELWIVDRGTTTEEAAGHAGGAAGRGGDLLYRWGNPRAHRAGTAADQRLFRPHHIHWIADGLPGAGHVLAFNNGDEFEGYARGWSSVVELALPAEGSGYRLADPATVWTYAGDPPSAFASLRLSGAQRLPNGNTLIAFGAEGTIFEVTPDGDTVWRFVNAHARSGLHHQGHGHRIGLRRAIPVVWDNLFNRAIRYAPDYPGLASLDLTPKGTIELPPPADWYAAVTAAEPAARGAFGVYRDGRTLTYVREDCAPEDTAALFFLHAWAANPGDLPAGRREAGFEAIAFPFGDRHSRFGGTCMMEFGLPDYALRSVRTGQYDDSGHLWDAEFALGAEAWLARFDALAAREPDARRAGFALRVEGHTLTLAREGCTAADIADRFFVHAYAPDGAREAIDFWFRERGERHRDRCLASVQLPPYPLARVAAGQYDASGHLWEAEIAAGE